MAFLLKGQGPLRSIICVVRVPSDIDDIAKNFAIIRTWKGVTVDLERKPLMYGLDEEGVEIATYAFIVSGTQNPECFLCITKHPDGYYWELSRAGGAEMHVFYKGEEIVVLSMPADHIGYFGGVI